MYKESILQISKCLHWYQIHKALCRITNGSRDYRYAVLRWTPEETQVLLRAGTDTDLPGKQQLRELPVAKRLLVRCSAQLLRRGNGGSSLVPEEEAKNRLVDTFTQNGFSVHSLEVSPDEVFVDKGSSHFVAEYHEMTAIVQVVDRELATKLWITGIGRSKGLGFGLPVDLRAA